MHEGVCVALHFCNSADSFAFPLIRGIELVPCVKELATPLRQDLVIRVGPVHIKIDSRDISPGLRWRLDLSFVKVNLTTRLRQAGLWTLESGKREI